MDISIRKRSSDASLFSLYAYYIYSIRYSLELIKKITNNRYMHTDIIRRNTLMGLIKIISNTNTSYKSDRVSKHDKKHKKDMFIYSISLFTTVYILLYFKLNMYSALSIEEYIIAFPAYTSLVLLVLFIIEKTTYHHTFIEWLNIIFHNQTGFLSNENIHELKLNNIYNRCIEESYLQGTDKDIDTIDLYIRGLQELLRFSHGYAFNFTTPSNFIKITVFLIAGFLGTIWSESFNIGDFSHIQKILPVLFLIAACCLIVLEVLSYYIYDFSEKKKINSACKQLTEIKYIIIDSSR